MEAPITTVVWINHNTRHISEVALEAINALVKLVSSDQNYELIIVENGSIDGSDKLIEDFLSTIRGEASTRIKYFKLSKNYGFTGAVHIAYKNRNPKAKYLMLVNTDLIIEPYVVKELICFLETHPKIAAVQGIVVDLNGDIVDSCGIILDEFLNRKKLYKGMSISNLMGKVTTPFPVSFVEGAVPIYNIDAIKECYKRDDIVYVPHAFVWYLEDMYLGLLLYNKGYYSVVIPKIIGRHHRGYALKKMDLSYVAFRNEIALHLLCINRTYPLRVLKIMIMLIIFAILGKKKEVKALLTGVRWALKLRNLFGILHLNNVPHLKSGNFIRHVLYFL